MKDCTPERRICPPEFQEAIDVRFGLNRFGGPKFRLAWGETETITVQGRRGYEQRLLCNNMPCWNILRWKAPETFGTPKIYDILNRDPDTHLCLLGEYPYEGYWENFMPLMSKDFSGGRLQVDAFQLDWYIIDALLPMLDAAEKLSAVELQASQEYIAARENKEQVEDITNRLMEDLPTRFGPVSYGRGGCKTSVIDRKMAQISQVWNRMGKQELRRQRTGFYQGN